MEPLWSRYTSLDHPAIRGPCSDHDLQVFHGLHSSPYLMLKPPRASNAKDFGHHEESTVDPQGLSAPCETGFRRSDFDRHEPLPPFWTRQSKDQWHLGREYSLGGGAMRSHLYAFMDLIDWDKWKMDCPLWKPVAHSSQPSLAGNSVGNSYCGLNRLKN